MSFLPEGTLTTDRRETAISETWETQSDWEAYQSISNINIENGTLQLVEISVPTEGLLHHYDFSDSSSTTSEIQDLAGNENITGSISGFGTINGVQSGTFNLGDNLNTTFSSNISLPYTVFYVGVFQDNGNQNTVIGNPGSLNGLSGRRYQDSPATYQMNAGGNFTGGNALVDETDIVRSEFSSAIYSNGSEVASGNAGSNDRTGIEVARDGNIEGEIGEVMIYDPDASGYSANDVEVYLADKWGVTL